jgi:outer membrane protein assembly factor BamB
MSRLPLSAFILSLACIAGPFLVTASGADVSPRGSAIAANWPQWRGPNRDGISPDTGLIQDWAARPPKLLWTAEGVGEGFASVSVAGDRIYTSGSRDRGQAVTCLSASDGKIVWHSPISDTVTGDGGYKGSKSTPTVDGDRLYVVSTDGKISCLKAADGSLVWSKDFRATWKGKMMSGWGYAESPLVDGDRVLCTPGGADAMIVALNKLTGDEIWRSSVPAFEEHRGAGDKVKEGAAYSSIVVSNGGGVKQYVQLIGRGVIGVRASDGQFLWGYDHVANGTANIPTCLVSGDYVFCSTGYGAGAALLKLRKDGDGMRCDEQYFLSGDKAQNHHGQMILKDGYVYFGHKHGQGFPICIELTTGKIAWGGSTRGPGNGSAAIAYADGNLVFRYQSGEVALIEATPEGYHLHGSFKPDYVSSQPCWSQPVIIGGRMYLRDQDKLMCYDVRAR